MCEYVRGGVCGCVYVAGGKCMGVSMWGYVGGYVGGMVCVGVSMWGGECGGVCGGVSPSVPPTASACRSLLEVTPLPPLEHHN